MQFRYSESDFPTVVDYLKYKPQILGLFFDEDAVEEECYFKKVYIRSINVIDQAARQRIKYALYSEQPRLREVSDEIISAMDLCDWKLRFRLSKAERTKSLLPKDLIYIVSMVLTVVMVSAFIYTCNKFLPGLLEAKNTILFIIFIASITIYISISEFYKFSKEKRKARRNEGLARLKSKNKSMSSKKSIANNSSRKTMPENTQGSKYNLPNAGNVSIYENISGDVINHYTLDSRQSIEDAREFLKMLEQICPDYLTLAEAQQQAIISTTIEQFKRDKSTTWQRLHSAGRTLLIESFKEILDIPAVNVVVETIKSYRDPE